MHKHFHLFGICNLHSICNLKILISNHPYPLLLHDVIPAIIKNSSTIECDSSTRVQFLRPDVESNNNRAESKCRNERLATHDAFSQQRFVDGNAASL